MARSDPRPLAVAQVQVQNPNKYNYYLIYSVILLYTGINHWQYEHWNTVYCKYATSILLYTVIIFLALPYFMISDLNGWHLVLWLWYNIHRFYKYFWVRRVNWQLQTPHRMVWSKNLSWQSDIRYEISPIGISGDKYHQEEQENITYQEAENDHCTCVYLSIYYLTVELFLV